jgi:hypothetical protein
MRLFSFSSQRNATRLIVVRSDGVSKGPPVRAPFQDKIHKPIFEPRLPGRNRPGVAAIFHSSSQYSPIIPCGAAFPRSADWPPIPNSAVIARKTRRSRRGKLVGILVQIIAWGCPLDDLPARMPDLQNAGGEEHVCQAR